MISLPQISVSLDTGVYFNKPKYTPFDTVAISIKDMDSNSDPARVETIVADVYTTSMAKAQKSPHSIMFRETADDSAMFEASARLTPDPAIWSGDIVVQRDDDLVVEFESSKRIISGKVDIDYYSSALTLGELVYNVTDAARIIVIDIDMNMHPDTIDTLQVRIWSSTDRGGLLLTLRETGSRTGVFEEILTFTLDEESTGNRLRVSEGDTVTVKYTDNTLPAPAALSENGFETVEVEELFASAGIGYLVPPLERAVASEPMIVDSEGNAVDALIGQNIMIQSELINNQKKSQEFAFIVQIKDNGVTVSMSWLTGRIPAEGSFKASQSWIPDADGRFSIEVFVWESIDNPVALSPLRSVMIDVL
jgi:hypothetical protein